MKVRSTHPDFGHAAAPPSHDVDEIRHCAARAAQCAREFQALSDTRRAGLLEHFASALEDQRAALVELADRETALGPSRLSGELDRTAFQLRAFAAHIAGGEHRRTVRQPAHGGSPPAARPSLIRTWVPIGPVAVFAAGNFPFAFSVLGGDTASALAAGNPVIVKAHPGHPLLSRAVWQLAQTVLAQLGVDRHVLQLVEGAAHAVGRDLVTAVEVKAVGFTGSLSAGKALQRAVNTRDVPIPFFGELSSINPVVAFPAAIGERGPELADQLAASITLGAGQFCTSPGVLLLLEHPASTAFVESLARSLAGAATHRMLSLGTREQFELNVERAAMNPYVTILAGGPSANDTPAPTLVRVSPDTFLKDSSLREEVFGPYCVVVIARDVAQVNKALQSIAGSLTTTIWAADDDAALAQPVVERALAVAGRVLFSGVPTGVAVAAAQQHGGPWPSSSRPDTTSVGLAAIERFMRPVALQDLPETPHLLPEALRVALEHLPAEPSEEAAH
ncbi:MAG: aldehyde dehydrogenase family protein [Vicinamibacterales bacterium]